tara:strand:- start:3206 stop:3607 length:402 start_codon:yes stop_codon:yes gene_type:complete
MEYSGSFTRNPEVGTMLLRPHNSLLNNVVVPSNDYANMAYNNAPIRPSNPAVARALDYRNTFYGRASNHKVVEKDTDETMDGGMNEMMEGGSFLNGNHWRLARDPTWYRGRGKARALQVFGNVADIAKGVGNF